MPGMWLRRSTSRSRKRRKMSDEQEASTSASPQKKRSSLSKSDSPQRSPNVKRRRTQAERYQSDVVEAFSKHSKTRTPTSAKKEVYFGKGAYLAVRSEGGYYLAQTLKYVYDNSRTLQIQWLEEAKPGIYKMSFLDFVDRDSVLTQVQLRPAGEKGLKKLPDNEISRIEKILNLSVKKEKGQLSDADGRASLDQLSEQLAKKKGKNLISAQKGNLRVKKTPVARTAAASIRRNARKERSGGRAAGKKKAHGKKETKRGRGGKKVEEKKKGRGKQDPNSKLVPNTKIELISKDPMFEVKNENSMPQVSKVVQCKRAIRAVLTNDMPLLKQLLANTKQVPSIFMQRSVDVDDNAFDYAIKANNHPFIKALLTERKNTQTRCPMPVNSLRKESTGSYNYMSLGHAVRSINISRGGREGNDAFVKDNYDSDVEDSSLAERIMRHGCNMNTLNVFVQELSHFEDNLYNYIVTAVKHGHRKLAGELVKRSNRSGGYGMNKLHEEVLLCDKPEELSPFKSVSVKKKPFTNDRMMPLHCAAINPNPKILEKLLSVVPEINVADIKGRKVIHYAAACTGSGPLECLLQRSAFPDDTDNRGNTPLMIAASLNRVQNIEVLVKKLKSEERGGVFRKNTFGQTPLHYAALHGQNDAVRALIKHGADLKAPLSAGKNKLTPFAVACLHGHLQTVKIMADSGAVLDQRDKLKRTPLMLAVMNGHTPIAAFLLRKGCDPNSRDSSGNTPLHYAAGYGWWFALRLLLSAGADPNSLNEWKVPPLAIAFMKGHVGCAELLLEDPSVDVNFRDSDGWTIVMLTVGTLTPEMRDQLKYLIEEKHASAALKDANDWNALHHLAAADAFQGYENEWEGRRKISIEMASLLISKGCDPLAKTSDGETALDISIKKAKNNTDLIKFLLDNGSQLTNFTNNKNENLLHLMAERCLNSDQTKLLKIIVDNMKRELESVGNLSNDAGAASTAPKNNFNLRELANSRDKYGHTPLLRWAQQYAKFSSRMDNQKLEQGRAFLQCLLQEGEPDVDEVVVDDKSESKTIVHILCSLHEKAGKVVSTGAQSDFPALEEVLRHKPNLNLRDKDGRTPLHAAIVAKRVALVKCLVQAGSDVTLISHNERNDQCATPIILALKQELFDLQDVLLTTSTVKSTSEPNKMTPLHYAALSHGYTQQLSAVHILQKLLHKGADVNCRDAKGRTPLHYLCQSYMQDSDPTTDAIEILLDSNADVFAKDEEGRLPLHYLFLGMNDASASSHVDPIEAVSILKDAMKKKMLSHPDKLGQTPLHAAALRGAIISVMAIAEFYSSVDIKDSFGNTPLAMATKGEHLSVVIFLLQKEASISVNVSWKSPVTDEELMRKKKEEEEEEAQKSNEYFWTWKPLKKREKAASDGDHVESLFRTVVRNGWQGILFLLMDRLEKCHVPYTTPIKAAIEEHRLKMASQLISKSRSHRLDASTGRQQNLLHILALESANQHCDKVAEKLLSKGVGLGHDQFNCSPLTYAILAENVSLCKLLWAHMSQQEKKEALTSTDSKCRKLLAAAFWTGHHFSYDIVSWLVQIKASLDIIMPVPLWQLEVKSITTAPSDKLEEWYHHNDHPVGYLSPLIAAIRVGNFQQVKFLLQQGADPNYPGNDSLTPLMHAVKKNDIKLVKVLLDHDFGPDKPVRQQGNGNKVKRRPFQSKSIGSFGVRSWKAVKSRAVVLNGGEDDGSDMEDEDANESDAEDEEDMENEEEEEEEERDEENEVNDEDMEDDENDDAEGENELNGEDDEVMDDEDDQENEDKVDAKMDKKSKGKQESKKVPFQMKSSVDLSAADSGGRTIIHHMMRTCDYGTYQNVEMLRFFQELGAPLDTKDKDGKTPLDYTLESGSSIMAEELQRLKKKTHMTMPTPKKSTWTDGCDWASEPDIDFRKDSQKFLDELRQKTEDSEELPKYPKPRVDEGAELKEAGVVLMDTDQDIPYDILMTKVDVKYGHYGMNNFYKMQVVYAKGKDMYVLLTRWGRIGDTGQYQRTPFSKKEEAVTEFSKIFKAKSGNQWSNVKEFTRQKGKYNLVRTDPYFDRQSVKKIKFDFKSDKPTKVPSGTRDLLKCLTAEDMLKEAMQFCGASDRLLPFGHLQREVLEKASNVLQEIQTVLKDLEKPNLSIDQKQEFHDKIADLSSEFYLLVPNDDFSYQSMTIIDNTETLAEAMQHLADMSDLELTGKMMLGAQQRVATVHPLDYIYRSLDCEIQPMSEDEVESQLILKQIHETGRIIDLKVQKIYRLRRKGEEERLTGCSLSNHKLLWHGTKAFNVLSILKRGMLITPIGAPITGSRFGMGIYHADMLNKSYHYCSGLSKDNSKFLFINEVALGKVQEHNHMVDDKLKKGFNSVLHHGRDEPDPAQDLLLPSGAVLPIGRIKQRQTGWGMSEFVVFKESQICLRYLVQIKS